jgi:hypothetical protein
VRVSRFSSIPLMNLLSCSVFWYFGVSLTLRLQSAARLFDMRRESGKSILVSKLFQIV